MIVLIYTGRFVTRLILEIQRRMSGWIYYYFILIILFIYLTVNLIKVNV